MDDEVQVQGNLWANSRKVEGDIEAGMPSAWDDNNTRKRRQRSCAYAAVVPSNISTEQDNAVAKGTEL